MLEFHFSCNHRKGIKTLDEVELFRALIDSFNFSSNLCIAEEFHQKAKVSFKPCGPYKKSAAFLKKKQDHVDCELSDIYLVAYDSNLRKIKHTFIQAKFDSLNDVDTICKHGSAAELHQWDLLRRRPKLISGKFKGISIPEDILKKAPYKSVGSYLFFSKHYDFCFFDASRLKPKTNKPTSKANIKYRCRAAAETVRSLDIERHISPSGIEFYQHVYDFKVGSPVDLNSEKVFLKQMLRYTKASRQEVNSELIDEVLGVALEGIDLPDNEINLESPVPVDAIIIVRSFAKSIEGDER